MNGSQKVTYTRILLPEEPTFQEILAAIMIDLRFSRKGNEAVVVFLTPDLAREQTIGMSDSHAFHIMAQIEGDARTYVYPIGFEFGKFKRSGESITKRVLATLEKAKNGTQPHPEFYDLVTYADKPVEPFSLAEQFVDQISNPSRSLLDAYRVIRTSVKARINRIRHEASKPEERPAEPVIPEDPAPPAENRIPNEPRKPSPYDQVHWGELFAVKLKVRSDLMIGIANLADWADTKHVPKFGDCAITVLHTGGQYAIYASSMDLSTNGVLAALRRAEAVARNNSPLDESKLSEPIFLGSPWSGAVLGDRMISCECRQQKSMLEFIEVVKTIVKAVLAQ